MDYWRNIQAAAAKTVAALSKAKTIIVFDTETTGLDFPETKIIQFSGIKYSVEPDLSFTKLEERDFYINPEFEIEDKITRITGITNDMLKNVSVESEMAPLIISFMESADIWVAYNAPFDCHMLQYMSKRTGIPIHFSPILDALPAARNCWPGRDSYKLSAITSFLFPDNSYQYHDSLADVQATADLLSACIVEYKKALVAMNQETQGEKVRLVSASCRYNDLAAMQQRVKLKVESPLFENEMTKAREEYLSKNEDKLKAKRVDFIKENEELLESYDEEERIKALSLEAFLPESLSLNTYGRIYWDVIKRCWGCKKDSHSRRLFHETDLADLENQFIARYSRTFKKSNMEDIGKAWLSIAKEEQKKSS